MESSQQFQNRVAGRTLDDFEVKSLLFLPPQYLQRPSLWLPPLKRNVTQGSLAILRISKSNYSRLLRTHATRKSECLYVNVIHFLFLELYYFEHLPAVIVLI